MLRLDWNSEESLELVSDKIVEGKVVLGSSDTVIGLLASANKQGYLSLNDIKKRVEKPYIVLIQSAAQAASFIDNVQYFQLENFLKKCWPGPVTIIFKARSHVPSVVTTFNGTIALRVPKHSGLERLLAKTGPLFSTSANTAGNAVPVTFEQIEQEVLDQVEVLILDPFTQNQAATPSTIIDLTTGQLRVIREGIFSVAQLTEMYNSTVLR